MSKNIFVAVMGRPNAGKSSLINTLIGEKVAIVSDKPQTTRTRVNAVLTRGETQYVFVDTPGLHKARNRLSAHMVKAIRTGITDVDAAVLVCDITKTKGYVSPADKELLEHFRPLNTPVILLLNKIDLIHDKSKMLPIMQSYADAYPFTDIIPISAKTGENVDKLLPILEPFTKDGGHFFPDDIISDQPEKIWLSEIIREKLLSVLREEVPHGIAVAIESFKEEQTAKGADLSQIAALIVVEKAAHKSIVIGKGGSVLKQVGEAARHELETYLGTKVNLTLFVKVKEDWRNSESFIAEMGLNATD
jgi:GTP-binding protein Era